MQIFKEKKKLINHLSRLPKNTSIGFAPTMGALHKGHMSLIQKSNHLCDITICSIFINPTQFNNQEDFINYPKDLDSDIFKLKKNGCDIAYIPEVNDLYEKNEKLKEFHFGKIGRIMEGKYRSGHFNGVANIVDKLFNIIKPQKAFFGQKDLQQLQIIKTLVCQTKKNIEITPVNTVREKNGLAKSSRNKLLNNQNKKTASIIYQCLKYCKENKQKGIKILKENVLKKMENEPNIKVEYLEFVSINSLEKIKKWENENESAICIAAYVANVRLIDNIIL